MASSQSDEAWEAIFSELKIAHHDFGAAPFVLSADSIKAISRKHGCRTTEPRLLCKQDTRESRPEVFKKNGCFILPKKNGEYYILKGEGYVDVPEITTDVVGYKSKLDFVPVSSFVGDSEMQYIDFAYASSLIRHFMNDPSLVLTIRGRKYTPKFSFRVCGNELSVESVQTEVDAGYEGENSVVLVEAKNANVRNTIIRQLYYPFRQWLQNTGKPTHTLFFERRAVGAEMLFYIWEYRFADANDYNSIRLVRSGRYRIVTEN